MVFNKFRVLMWKSYRLRRYHWIATLLEFCFPIIITYIMLRNLGSQKKYKVHDAIIYDEISLEELTQSAQKFEKLHYTPSNNFTDKLMNNVINSLKLKNEHLVKNVNADVLRTELQQRNASSENRIGVVFHDVEDFNGVPNTLNYDIRQPQQWATSQLYKSVSVQQLSNSLNSYKEDEYYLTRGFVGLQLIINEEFIRLKIAPITLPQNKLILQPLPYPSFKFNENRQMFSPGNIVIIIGVVVVTMIMTLSIMLINDVIEEKESGVKEMMKIAGVNEWIIWMSWYLYAFVVSCVSLTVVAILLKYPFYGEDTELLHFINFPIFWMVLLMYCLGNTSYCFMFCAIFHRAAVATSLFMLSFATIIFGTLYLQKLNFGYAALISCFFPVGAFLQAFHKMWYYESLGIEFSWESLSLSENTKYDISLLFILIMFVVNTIGYFLLTIYIIAINPGKYGVPKSPFFIFKSSFNPHKTSIKHPKKGSPSTTLQNKFFEPPPPHLEITIRMKNLVKQYGLIPAVNGVDLNIYKDEITVFLGHNGAGKTTIMSMLTGLTAPSGGSIYYKGKDIFRNMEAYRKHMGLCPQENRLLAFLSVQDHLWFFGMLKGISSAVIVQQSDKYLQIMEMKKKKSSKVKELSGGMKRKLSLAISLLGRPEILILDEPTSGIDVQSRRKIWDLLLVSIDRGMRKNHSIILTTHHMEEADALGDRIVIMNEGVIVCHGTPIFLKKSYGTGYELTITKAKGANTEKITQIIQKVIPNATEEHETNDYIVYKLPLAATHQFPTLFGNLESNKSGLAISTIGVSYTSMEHVFLKVGEVPVYNSGKFLKVGDTKSKRVSVDHRKNTKSFFLMIQQIMAIIKKKFLYTKRNLFGLFIGVVLPTIILLIVLRGSSRVLDFAFNVQPPLDLSLKSYPTSTVLIPRDNQANEDFFNAYSQYVQEHDAEIRRVETHDIIKELLLIGKKNIITYNRNLLTAVELNQTSIKVLFNLGMLHALPIAISTYSNALLRSIAKNNTIEIITFNYPISELDFDSSNCGDPRQQKYSIVLIWLFALGFYTIDVMFYFTKFINTERINGFKHIQMMSSVSPFIYWFSTLLFDFISFELIMASRIMLFKLFDDDFKLFEFTDSFVVLVTIMMAFGVSGLLFDYVISYLSNSRDGSYATFFILNSITFLLIFLYWIYEISYFTERGKAFIESSLLNRLIYHVGKYIILLVPLFNFSSIFTKFIITWAENSVCDLCPPAYKAECEVSNPKKSYWDYPHRENIHGLRLGLIFFIIDAILYAILLCLINLGYLGYVWNIMKNLIFGKKSQSHYEGDNDVVAEHKNVKKVAQDSSKLHEVPLLVDGLRKNYITWFRPSTAVADASFIVGRKECFGLIGVNGAGKTTTFKMLTAQIPPTDGDAAIEGVKMSANKTKYLSKAGYCAQTNSFVDELTGREMLEFIASLRGIVKDDIEKVVDKWISIIGLQKYQNLKCGNYSGGNQRKLCTAMSLIGNPSVVFLDEPTSGVDPVSKLKLYQVMEESKQSGQAVVLTSHNMEECENLCDRLTVLTQGVMRCIGSPQHLKKLYAQGFSALIKLNVELNFAYLINELKQSMVNAFTPQHCILKDEHKGLLYYQITNISLPWSMLFQKMEDIKKHYHDVLEDYVLTDTTLEEVFISFAERDDEDEYQSHYSNLLK